eukprot:4466025-Prymnesium_polylepis.1
MATRLRKSAASNSSSVSATVAVKDTWCSYAAPGCAGGHADGDKGGDNSGEPGGWSGGGSRGAGASGRGP